MAQTGVLPKKTPKKALTIRQLKYKKFRLKGMSQRQASLAAGYAPTTATHSVHKTEGLVKAGMVAALDKAGLTDEVISAQLKSIATLDPRKAFDKNGNLLPVSEWPDELARVVSSIESDELFEGSGKDREHVGETKKIKFWDKLKALELASRLKKHLSDQPILDNSIHTHFTVILDGQQASHSNLDGQAEPSVPSANEPR